LNIRKAQYLSSRLLELPGWEPIFTGPVYNEFAVRCPDAREVNRRLEARGIVGGYDLEKDYPELKNCLLFCATEMLRKKDMDRVAALIA